MKPTLKHTLLVLSLLSSVIYGFFSLVSCKKAPFYATDGTILILSADRSVLTTGSDSCRLTIMGFSADGEALHDHTQILFTASLGRVEPASIELMGGSGSVVFISGDSSGIANIQARSGTIIAEPNPLQITIGSAALDTLTISANPATFPPGGGRALIRAHAFDSSGNLLVNIPLLLSASSGSFENKTPVLYTNSQGYVENMLQVTESTTVKVDSGAKTAQVEIIVATLAENQLPRAQFTHSPSSPKRNQKINFNGSLSTDTDGSIVSWAWDFGDGKTASGETVTHAYSWDGQHGQSFTVILKVTDDRGGVGVQSETVSVEVETANQLPVANFSYSPSPALKGQVIYFNGALSKDTDGTVETWQWNFGDGTSATGEQVSHSFTWTGSGDRSFDVLLTVTDNNGGTGIIKTTLSVKDETIVPNQPPKADFSYSPQSPKMRETIYFNGSSSTDSDGEIVSWQWDFGDGSTGSGETITHRYSWTGSGSKSFTVILKVTDEKGGSAITTQAITVSEAESNALPFASFSYSPSAPSKNETISFNGSTSSDDDGHIATWEWVLGDGTTLSGEVVTHAFTWATAGNKTYTVSLKVTDDKGGTDTMELTITVLE